MSNEKFKNIQEKFSISKMIINVMLTFFFPIVMFSIPISGEMNFLGFLGSIKNKLEIGVLFTTSFGITATILTSYFDTALKLGLKETKELYLKSTHRAIIVIFLLSILSAVYYGAIMEDKLNTLGICIQLVLYVLIVIAYGYSDNKITKANKFDQTKFDELDKNIEEKIEQQLTKTVDENSIQEFNGKKI